MFNLAQLRGLSPNNQTTSLRRPEVRTTASPANTSTPTARGDSFTASVPNQVTTDINAMRNAARSRSPRVVTQQPSPPSNQAQPNSLNTVAAAATRPPQNPNQTDLQALGLLSNNFQAIDTSRDGFLSEEEIQTFQRRQDNGNVRRSLGNIANDVPILMYSTIQEGDDANFGIGRDDINATTQALRQGQSLQQYQDGIVERVVSDDNFYLRFLNSKEEALRAAVRVNRGRITRRRQRLPGG